MGYLVDIDSGERDPIEYPNPNDYTIHLNNRIYDITNIKIVSARIPNCQPLINAGNKQFDVDGTTIVLSEGTYTNGTDLASNLQSSLGDTIDSVTFDSFTNKLTFSNVEDSTAFSFNFYGGSNGYATSSTVGPPAHVLGFSGANTESATSITSSYIDLNGPTSIFVRITNGLEDLDKPLYIDGGTFSTSDGTFDSQNMKQISPHYIGRIMTSNINEIIDFNGNDDPIHHNFIKGTGKFIDDLRIRFYYNNGTKLIPYDFGKRNHILKIEVECSLDKSLGQPNTFGGTVPMALEPSDLPPPIEIPNLMPKNRFDNSQKTILIVSVISLLMGLALLSFMRRKKTL
jgi:hypothetical protein